MSPYATQAQWSPSQRALSCVCVLYWLSRGSMQHFYLWFISPGLQAHWVLFDWVLWPLGFKVGSRERQSIPVQVTWPSLREIVLSVYFCLQKKKQGIASSPPLTHTHRALNQQSSLLHPTIQASTAGEQPHMALTWSFWDEAERNRNAVALLSAVLLSHIHSHTPLFSCTCEKPHHDPWSLILSFPVTRRSVLQF